MVTQKAKGVIRSAILVPNELERKTILLNGLSNDDITTIQCEIDKNHKIIFSSIYMDKEKDIPIEILNKITNHAKIKNIADKLAKLATSITSTIHNLKISMSHIIKEMKEKLHKNISTE